MRRANKILMATVAVLLCLVLISTSIVSGVFARFAITKKAETTVKLEQFGVTIELTPDPNLVGYIQENLTVNKGDSVSITLSGVELIPGNNFYKALNVQVGGTPNVDVDFTITCEVDYDYESAYFVPSEISGYEEARPFMPIGYTVWLPGEKTQVNICAPWHFYIENKIEEIIIRNASKNLFGTTPKEITEANIDKNDATNFSCTKKFNQGIPISEACNNITDFYFGFFTPKSYNKTNSDPDISSAKIDEIATYIAEKASAANSPITFTYTFSIVQVS